MLLIFILEEGRSNSFNVDQLGSISRNSTRKKHNNSNMFWIHDIWRVHNRIFRTLNSFLCLDAKYGHVAFAYLLLGFSIIKAVCIRLAEKLQYSLAFVTV